MLERGVFIVNTQNKTSHNSSFCELPNLQQL